mgnify:CR=1 FL=1
MPTGTVRVRRVAAGGALTILLLAFATCGGGNGALVSPGGRLQVVNQAGEPLEVFAAGNRVMARLEDGNEARLDRLPLGDCALEARGHRTGWRMGTTVRLDSSTEATWTVRASEGHAEALKNLPAGRVRFVNRSPEPVRAFIDDVAKELVWPGGEAEFAGVSEGRHSVRADGTQTAFRTDAEVEVSAGVATRFEVNPPQAALRATNRSGGIARISIRDEVERQVPAGGSATFDRLAPGAIDVSARDDQGRFLFKGVATLEAGKVADVVVPAPEGVLSVLSDLAVPVSVWIDGASLGLCGASGAAEFKGLPVGDVHVEALDPESRVVARAVLKLKSGSPTLWMVREGGDAAERRGDEGSLSIENGSPEPMRVQVDGGARGEVQPGARRVVPGLLPGVHQVAVFGLRSRDIQRADVTVSSGAVATWVARPRSATLSLKNLRDEEVRVRIDGETMARLAPAQSLDLLLPGGAHRIEAVGVTTLRSTVHSMELPATVVTRLPLPSPTATLVATNRRGEPLTLFDGDRQLGVILPGDRVTLRDIEPGDHQLQARSLDRPLTWHVRVNLAAGDSYSWDLGD